METKLDDTFPTFQFLMKGFAEPVRLDGNRNGGEVMIYICSDQYLFIFAMTIKRVRLRLKRVLFIRSTGVLFIDLEW